MSIYARFKKNPDGFRQLVELLESTGPLKRQKMIEAGMKEDHVYTQQAVDLILNFHDIIALPDMELAEVLANTQAEVVALAVYKSSPEVKEKFLSKAPVKFVAEIKETWAQAESSSIQMGACQMKLIGIARKLEKKGYVKTKKIPSQPG